MASLQSKSTFSFKHHLTRHGQLAEQFYLFQTPLDRRGMASLQGNCTSSITTRQARHANLAWSPYIVRTSNIAKNRHKHRFASGTVSKNRHLYRIRCDTFGPALPKHLDQKIRIPGDRRLSTYRQLLATNANMDDRPYRSGKGFLTHFG